MIKVTLEEANPELVKEWHPSKNGRLTPRDVTPHSGKRVWWKCDKGHEWQATIDHRSNGTGCPYCSGRAACDENCLATLNPDLAKEWHPTKNSSLTPRYVTSSSNRKVWWLCTKNKNHEWQTKINNRSNGTGCPYCSGRAACDENCLATLNPDLAKEWHPTKNGSLTPGDVTEGSGKKVWWICDKGHEWEAAISGRSSGNGCPYCSGKATCDDNCLSTLNPALSNQWHPTRNLPLTPTNVTAGSHKKVWWICDKSHIWQAEVKSRVANHGCPYCSGRDASDDNCLATLNPDLAKKWHPTKNGSLTPGDVTEGSGKKVWWICDKGHEWEAAISGRSSGNGCPYCSGKATCDDNCLSTLNSDLSKEWHPTKNGSLTPGDVTEGSGKKVWWICDKGHEWQAVVESRSAGSGCPYCYRKISQLELRIYCELKYLFSSTMSKEKIFGKECDVYISEIKAGIEVDGLYWHRDKYLKDKKKADAIRSRGITLINVREVGLERIADTDIFCTSKDSTLAVVKKIVGALNEQCSLNWNKRKAIDEYLQRQTIANDSEYKKLWDMLPSPFPGLSLLEQNPDFAKEWHPTKNGSLTPRDVSLFSNKKVWWLCSKNKSHEWTAVVNNRSNGTGCPYCSGRAACDDNSLAITNPDLAKEWHPTKNGSLTPRDATPRSGRKVWWLCSKNKSHEWQATIDNRSAGKGCPKCRGLKQSKSA